ncbi:MAG: hypothetical protein R3B98_07135 [Hyphomonas sp.]
MEAAFQSFLSAIDWVGIPRDITVWELINSDLITAAIIGAVGLFLNRKVNRLSERAEDTATAAAYERELRDFSPGAESPAYAPMPEAQAGGPGYELAGADDEDSGFERVAEERPAEAGAAAPAPKKASRSAPANPLHVDAAMVVQEAKKLVDASLEDQKDGRKRRKYRNIGSRDYRLRILAARDDGLMSQPQSINLLGIFETWRPYATGRKTVTEDVLATLKHLLTAAQADARPAGRR